MCMICLIRGLSSIGIGVIQLLSLVCLFLSIMKSLQRYTGQRPYASGIVAHFNLRTTTVLSIHLSSCLTAIQNHVIKYCPTVTVYKWNGKHHILDY